MFLFPRPHPLERRRTFRDLRTRLGPPAFFIHFGLIRSPTLGEPVVASGTKEWAVFPPPSSDSLYGSHALLDSCRVRSSGVSIWKRL
jgi:hypothetical protein